VLTVRKLLVVGGRGGRGHGWDRRQGSPLGSTFTYRTF
jgi:hypothetical protein